MEDLNETRDEMDRVRKTLARTQEGRDMWRRLIEDCNKMQGEEIECLRQEYKEQPERLGIAKAEGPLPAGNIPRGKSPMELLTPRGLSQTTEVQLSTGPVRVTIPDPGDTLGDPVVETTMRQLVEAAGRILVFMNVPDSGVTAPYGTIDDTGGLLGSDKEKQELELLRKRDQEKPETSGRCRRKKCQVSLTYRKTTRS